MFTDRLPALRRFALAAPLSLVLLSAAIGCDRNPSFSVEGDVKGGGGKTLVLERLDADAGWVAIDSVTAGSDGSFDISSAAPETPELYRLGLDGSYVYLPVDSIDRFTLKADAADFAGSFALGGTSQAEQLTLFEREARKVAAMQNTDSTEAFRRRVYARYLQNAKGNILSYYILTRKFGDGYLIDFTHPFYAAVATAFTTHRPDDPHTRALAKRARQGQAERRKQAGRTQVIEASQTAMIEISLPGKDGKPVALSSLLGKGKPVVVAFTALTMEGVPAINKRLAELYEQGLTNIYEVCLDADQYAWKQAAKALPWTVVYDPDATRSQAALHYNVGSIPAFFIYNGAGELIQSTGNVADIASML
ncbi:MAG: redoxin domain-containing protein [Muribaculaceae bacterium]|nr:redoxin domain-containing protein [Muribaculaceae bacterium]